MNLFAIKKRIIKLLRPVYNFVTTPKRILKENERLKYQIEYLRKHIEAKDIKPATGIIREYQLKELEFMKEIISYMEEKDIKPFLDGGCLLGYHRHNAFVPWDDDIDLGVIRSDFEKAIEVLKEKSIFMVMDNLTDIRHPFYGFYNKVITENPNKLIAILSSTCIHIFKGTSLKDAINVELFPYDFVKNSITEEDFVKYKEESTNTINKLKRSDIKKVFNFFETELKAETVFTRNETKRISYGLGNYAFTEYRFRGFLNYEDVFPIKESTFEGYKVYIPNNTKRALECLYGDYMSLPKDVGISHTFEDINSYLKDNNIPIIDYRNI